MAQFEEEVALLIRGDNPQEKVYELAKLNKFGYIYKLMPRPNQLIRDTYYDTPWGAISKGKSSFRIREVNGKKLVTIKSGKFLSKGGVSKRIEQEVEWPFDVEPESVIKLFDLEPFQIRENLRIVRDVTTKLDGVVAELAIDQVTYQFPYETGTDYARFYEVEIEAKSDKAQIDQIASALQKQVKGLKSWDHSKLSMGKAIETALRVKRQGILLTDDALDAVAEMIDS